MQIQEQFTFGKYRGTTPKELINSGKGVYLIWCLENVKNFHLEPLSFEEAIRKKYLRQYLTICRKKHAYA